MQYWEARLLLVPAACRSDVVVIGAGIAGLTTSIVLALDGFEVILIDPDPTPPWRVGESLDWSAGPLLERLGLPISDLVGTGLATYKREVRGYTTDGHFLVGRPYDWLVRWPFRFEADTIHLERGGFDRRLHERALEVGVRVVQDAVHSVDMSGDRLARCTTRSGQNFIGYWFIDASGRARVVGRAASVETSLWSERRLSVWSHCRTPADYEGTSLHLDGSSDQFGWAWEIPVAPERLSVGVVMVGDQFRKLKRDGLSLEGILDKALASFPSCEHLASATWGPVRVRSYRAFVSDSMCGPNWLLTGEAACFVDPLTSVGVTSAMRHGCEAAEAVSEATAHPERRNGCLRRYERRTRGMARLYNEGVERLLYDPSVRRVFGIGWAVRAYVTMGYATTSLYGKLPTPTKVGTAGVSGLLRSFRLWIRMWTGVARLLDSSLADRHLFRMSRRRSPNVARQSGHNQRHHATSKASHHEM